MADTVFMQRTLGGLKATDAAGEEALAKIKPGQEVKVEITRPRHLVFHRKYFALLNVIYPHQSAYPTMTSFRGAMAVALGFGETVKLSRGRSIILPHSISFASMDQTEFEQLYDKTVELILTRILPGIDRDDVAREVEQVMLGYSEAQREIA